MTDENCHGDLFFTVVGACPLTVTVDAIGCDCPIGALNGVGARVCLARDGRKLSAELIGDRSEELIIAGIDPVFLLSDLISAIAYEITMQARVYHTDLKIGVNWEMQDCFPRITKIAA